MIDLSLLPDGGMAWLEASGPGSHLVGSTRGRLARNLDRHRFITRTDPAEREAILAEVEAAASDTGGLGRAVRFRIDRLELVDRQLLHERHLVSRELAAPETGSRVRPGAGVQGRRRAGVRVKEADQL